MDLSVVATDNQFVGFFGDFFDKGFEEIIKLRLRSASPTR